MNDRPLTRVDLDEALEKHTSDEMPKIKVMINDAISNVQHQIMQAFPNGLEGHREAHEQMIRAAKAEEDFWHDLKLDIAKKSIWGILHILFVLALGTVAVKLGLGSVFGIGK